MDGTADGNGVKLGVENGVMGIAEEEGAGPGPGRCT
jgi:hypothetical protein